MYLLWPRDYITETGLLKNFLFYAQATSVVLEASAKWVDPVPIIKDVCASLSPSLPPSLPIPLSPSPPLPFPCHLPFTTDIHTSELQHRIPRIRLRYFHFLPRKGVSGHHAPPHLLRGTHFHRLHLTYDPLPLPSSLHPSPPPPRFIFPH